MTVRHAWIALLFVAVVAVSPRGQSATQSATGSATIEGTVVDGAGRVLAGAGVSLHRATTAVERVTANSLGRFTFARVPAGDYTLRASLSGFKTAVVAVSVNTGRTVTLRVPLEPGAMAEEVTVTGAAPAGNRTAASPAGGAVADTRQEAQRSVAPGQVGTAYGVAAPPPPAGMPAPAYHPGGRWAGPRPTGTESYAHVEHNSFRRTVDEPLSTFAADVDTASYTNVRRFLSQGQLPPVDAVRVEEFVNYFTYRYPEPDRGQPVSITTEVGEAPWAPGHRLVLVGLRARPIEQHEVAGRNIVLLIDVSGSMRSPDKLPLVKTGLRMFVDHLRDDDRIAIVVYAGASGLALPSTPGRHRERIHDAIESLEAGGSTNGGEGLRLAYRVADEHFIRGGINRVILATDGDFNVGVTSQGDLLRLIEQKKTSGVFLSVLGVGTGNLKDSTMEMLADKGNGHYSYLDSLQEARRVLVREGGATLETVAKDVKLQVEFNPATVQAWKLIGYENRLLAHQDFNDDRKDGGEMGAGHTVTVLYEVVPVGARPPADVASGDRRATVDPLVYQSDRRPSGDGRGELMRVKVRFKQPDEDVSSLMTQAVTPGARVRELPFAAAVAEFGLLLRDEKTPAARWRSLRARVAALQAPPGLAAERDGFAELVELAAGLARLRQ